MSPFLNICILPASIQIFCLVYIYFFYTENTDLHFQHRIISQARDDHTRVTPSETMGRLIINQSWTPLLPTPTSSSPELNYNHGVI